MAVMMLERGVSFRIALPYPVSYTIDEPPEKPLDIHVNYAQAMEKLAKLGSMLPIQEVRVTPSKIELTLVVRSLEEQSAPAQLDEIEVVLVDQGFASRDKWL